MIIIPEKFIRNYDLLCALSKDYYTESMRVSMEYSRWLYENTKRN
jgi:hypothetical protein